MTVVPTTVVPTIVVDTIKADIFLRFHLANFGNYGTKKKFVFPCTIKKIFLRAFLYIYKPK